MYRSSVTGELAGISFVNSNYLRALSNRSGVKKLWSQRYTHDIFSSSSHLYFCHWHHWTSLISIRWARERTRTRQCTLLPIVTPLYFASVDNFPIRPASSPLIGSASSRLPSRNYWLLIIFVSPRERGCVYIYIAPLRFVTCQIFSFTLLTQRAAIR